MKSVRYKKWDGSQEPFELKKKRIVETFLENIIKGMNPRTSLAQMMWSGFPLSGMNFRVMGLEEMIQELQNQIDDLFATYHLAKAFDQPINDFRHLLSQERSTRHEKGLSPSPSYEQLPAGLLEKLKKLENYEFLNNSSRQLFAHWQNRQTDILDLYEFYSEYAHRFTGPEAVDFDQALELMRLLKSIEKIRQQIMNGQFSTIDPQTLTDILGENAAKSFNILIELPQMMTAEGIVESLQEGFDMTPRGMRTLGELAFGKIYHHIKRDKQGGQSGNAPHSGEIEPDSSRPYQYGDRFDLDISKTILKAVSKGRFHQGRLKLSPADFYIREREQLITSTTVVLLDLSWSMSWEGRFEAAKKVALALNHYIRSRFPKDKLHIVGFCTEARELKGAELALAQWDPGRPFTNLQDGLRLAMRLIKKSGNRNNRVIVITDGQPTAYYDRDRLHVELPEDFFGLSPNACKATLAEVKKVTAQGMNIETFMLDDNPVLVEFTREMTRINGGRAVLCLPGELGKLILIEEIKRRGGRT
jgi:uncharacterized protein with von Willebrand factor type A (vWA) domain